jgi:hypothetical protein
MSPRRCRNEHLAAIRGRAVGCHGRGRAAHRAVPTLRNEPPAADIRTAAHYAAEADAAQRPKAVRMKWRV